MPKTSLKSLKNTSSAEFSSSSCSESDSDVIDNESSTETPKEDKKQKKPPKDSNKLSKDSEYGDALVDKLIKLPSLLVIAGKSKRGKSYLIQYVVTVLGTQKKIKFGLVFCRTKFNCGYDYFPDNKIIEGFKEDLLVKYLEKLKKYGEDHPITEKQKEQGIKTNIPPSIIIFDDIIGQINMNSNIFTNFLSSYRHYNISIIIATQFINKISTLFREQADIAIMFEQNTRRSIESLYESYGQEFDNYNSFKNFLKQNTSQPYQCCIFCEDPPEEFGDSKYFNYIAPANYKKVKFNF